MSDQADFLKNVQQKATARLEKLNGNARKMFTEAVEKGKASRKDLSAKLEPAVKRVADAGGKARTYLDDASRKQDSTFAGGLRKVAERLDAMRRHGFWHPRRNDVDAGLAALRGACSRKAT